MRPWKRIMYPRRARAPRRRRARARRGAAARPPARRGAAVASPRLASPPPRLRLASTSASASPRQLNRVFAE